MRSLETRRGHPKAKRAANLTVSYLFLILICVLWIFPFFYLILQSLRGESTGVVVYIFPKQLTFDNYIKLFTDATWQFGTWYLNTVIIAIFTSLIQTIIVLLTAYALSRMRFQGRTALMRFMLIIGMFPGFLSMVCIYFILKTIGLATSIYGLVIVYCSGSMMGYYICKGFFDTISKSLDEAAMIDGASRNVIFWKVIMPLSKPIIIYTILTSFLGPWGDYMMSNFLVARGTQSTWTVAVGMQNWLSTSNMPYYFTRFCAGGVVVSIVPTILFFFLQRFYVEGVTGGSVKG
jgi:arabinogalactan oligomer/maltooligosaccharide transport system permease protein